MKIQIVEYDTSWPNYFEKEAEILQAVLGGSVIEIHHIGSTAVPTMEAKPVIDIMPIVYDINQVDEVAASLEKAGYQAMGEYGISLRRYFRKEIEGVRTHNIHFYPEGHEDIGRLLYFRDYLREHKEAALEYSSLKKKLAVQFPDNMDAYTKGKNEFVRSILENKK